MTDPQLGKHKRVTGRAPRESETKGTEQALWWDQEEERARERAAVATAPTGRRNATLNRAAFNLGQLVAAGLVDVDQVRVVLLAAALEAGNPEAKARATIESGLRGGAAKPRRRRAGAAP